MARAGITANHVILSAAVLSVGLGLAIAASRAAAWSLLLLSPFLFLRMALNAIDGMLAPEFGEKSPLGAVLNELSDVVSDTALYLPFALIPGLPPILVAAVVAIAIMPEMAG